MVNCFHISLSDSGSSGDIKNGDFIASTADFSSIEELSNYIQKNNFTIMNEANVVASLDSVVGLFINKCEDQHYLLSLALVVQEVLKNMLDIEYPIYLYDFKNGKIEQIELLLFYRKK